MSIRYLRSGLEETRELGPCRDVSQTSNLEEDYLREVQRWTKNDPGTVSVFGKGVIEYVQEGSSW